MYKISNHNIYYFNLSNNINVSLIILYHCKLVIGFYRKSLFSLILKIYKFQLRNLLDLVLKILKIQNNVFYSKK